ncbi:hypothetical protein ACU4GI_46855 (plasmid) [Cupriavidus basilensis]
MIRQQDIRRATLQKEANQSWASLVFFECMAAGMFLAAFCVMKGMNPYASLALAALTGFIVLSSHRARWIISCVATLFYTLVGAYVGYAMESWTLGIVLSIFVFLLSWTVHDMGNQHYDDFQARRD